jgi:hypothetical protein
MIRRLSWSINGIRKVIAARVVVTRLMTFDGLSHILHNVNYATQRRRRKKPKSIESVTNALTALTLRMASSLPRIITKA